jgi:TolB-like protein/DNA-binding SARP family transcriptional activator
MLELKLFGYMELSGPGGRIDLANAKLSALLAYLVLSSRRPLPREQLTDLLWGSHFEEQARQNFRQALSRLRKLLGSDLFATEDQFIQIEARKIESDVARFESLLRDGSTNALRAAVKLAEGELLEGIAVKEAVFTEWLATERNRIGKLVCDALLKLGESELAEGSSGAALERAQAITARDEYNESGHRLAMRSYVALGRRTDALRYYQDFNDRLSRNLGAEPDPETAQLAAGLRSGIEPKQTGPLDAGRPSIAVMPFANLSSDPDQEYFADGMVDEIITALSRFTWLTVIARNSTFAHKGRSADARQVSQELGVRYVLEGSVRKAGGQLRISGQLIEAASGGTIWADRFDGALESVFHLQDQVTAKVVSAIAPKLEQAEIERARRKPTGSLDAYDYYLRGVAEVHRWTRDANRNALRHFYRAIEIDPRFAPAYGMAARCLSQRKTANWVEDADREIAEAERLADLAVELGRDDPIALAAAGLALAFVVGRVAEGGALIDRCLALNPNIAWAWLFGGWVKAWSGDSEEAIARVNRAIALSPNDPYLSSMRRALAFAHFVAGRYAEAIDYADMNASAPQNAFIALATVAACSAFMGQMDRAHETMTTLRAMEPHLRCSNLRRRFPMTRDEDLQHFANGLRLAGLPE